ncbi:sigma-70 family RNA polymerase sigma factor [bacterium]|nr:sigma-70 family RNA polymerase sigma factor [bacterium]
MTLSSDTGLQGLIDGVRSGDATARELLLDHACDRLYRLTRKMLRHYPTLRRWEATDDVLQNSLVRLHRALAEVDVATVAHFFNLAATQIRRELLDLVKHHMGPEGAGRHHHTDHQPPDDDGGSLQNRFMEPENMAMWTEFHEAVARLAAEHREVIDLLFYDGISQHEAADVLGVSIRTLKRRWQQAKLVLHEALRDGRFT